MSGSIETAPQPLRAAVIGLGGIAWRLAEDDTASRLTHAGTLNASAHTMVVGGASPVADERDRFFRAFSVPVFETPEAMLNDLQPDIVSICSPTEHHAQHLELCLRQKIKMVWLEKPPSATTEELRRLMKLQDSLDSASRVLVNFQRRYMAPYRLLRALARRFSCLHIAVNYSRGLVANGSHMADIISFVTGDQGGIVVEAADRAGPSPSAFLRSPEGIPISFVGSDLPFHNVDIALTFEWGRISVLHGGMTLRCEPQREHEFFPGFFRLSSGEERECGSALLSSMPRALSDLVRKTSSQPYSNLSSAFHGAKIIEEIQACVA